MVLFTFTGTPSCFAGSQNGIVLNILITSFSILGFVSFSIFTFEVFLFSSIVNLKINLPFVLEFLEIKCLLIKLIKAFLPPGNSGCISKS